MFRKEGIRAANRKRARVSTRPRASNSQPRNNFMSQPSGSSSSVPLKEKTPSRNAISRTFQNLLATLESVKKMALNPTLWRTAFKGSVFVIISLNLYATAWGTYATFYSNYIPVLTSVTPVYFNFGTNPPSAKIPAASKDKPALFDYGQPYDITLELEVPESEINLGLGNFMVRLELQNRGGRDLFISERPSLVLYRSALLRRLSTLVYSIPLLLDVKSEQRVLSIPLAEGFMDDYDDIITDVEVKISNPNLQIYSSRLRVDAHLTGLRYIMYHWPAMTATFFTTFFFMAEILFCLIAWQVAVYLWAQISKTPIEEEGTSVNHTAEMPIVSTEGTASVQPIRPESPIAMAYTEEEEWERLSNNLSTGALTPPTLTPLSQPQTQFSHQAGVNSNSLRYRTQFSQSPTQSFVRGEDSNMDMDLLRFMSQAQDHLTASSSQHNLVDVDQQSGTLVGFDGVEKDLNVGEGSLSGIFPTPESMATPRPNTSNKKSQ